MPLPGAHRRSSRTRPLWPRTDRSRHLVTRLVALYAALVISISYDDMGVGPVEVGAAVTALCVAATLQTGLSSVLVRLVQRATALTLLLLTASLWSRGQPWGLAASALALAVCALWWMEEDERRGTAVEESVWRAKLLRELHVVRQAIAATEPRLAAVLEPVQPVMAFPGATPGHPVRSHHARPARRRGAHRSPVRTHRPARSPAADTVPAPRVR